MFFFDIHLLKSSLFNDFADHHSHILPGVDDGVQKLEESLQILEWYKELGITSVTFTPHIMELFPNNNRETLQKAFADFTSHYNGDIKLSLAAEYMLDSKFEEHLEGGDLLTLFDDYVLVECSYMQASNRFFDLVETTINRGYHVVIAHPERYLYLSTADYAKLKEMGAIFQLNLLSILGGYGKSIKERAKSLLKLSYYDLIGTDIHAIGYYKKIISKAEIPKKVLKQLELIKDIEL